MPRKTIGKKIPPILKKPVIYPPVQLALPKLFTRVRYEHTKSRRGAGRQGPRPSVSPKGESHV